MDAREQAAREGLGDEFVDQLLDLEMRVRLDSGRVALREAWTASPLRAEAERRQLAAAERAARVEKLKAERRLPVGSIRGKT